MSSLALGASIKSLDSSLAPLLGQLLVVLTLSLEAQLETHPLKPSNNFLRSNFLY